MLRGVFAMRKITEKDIKVVSAFLKKYPTAATFGIGLSINVKKEVSK